MRFNFKLPQRPPGKRKRRKGIILHLLGFAFTAGVILFLVAAAGAGYVLWSISKELPDYEGLANYEPKVMTRIHANDGRLIAEYAHEKRIYVPIETIPDRVVNAFISAEDKNFYQHEGLDFQGIVRAVVINIQNLGKGRRPVGASTITQQVAKNFLLSSDVSLTRKVKEAILAIRIERTFSKKKILELYLNEIYLGMGSYGVAAAALNYFGKELHELNLQEVAYLASLPKAPNNYNPFKHHRRALIRRNWVIDRIVENGYASQAEGEAAKNAPLTVKRRPFGKLMFAADYFAEEVRRELVDIYGEKRLYEGGLSVRTTLNPEYQEIAQKVLRKGLVAHDRRHGWRGPIGQIDIAGDWGPQLAKINSLTDIAPWRLGVVLSVDDRQAVIGLQPSFLRNGKLAPARDKVSVPFDEVKWARKAIKKSDGHTKRGPKIKAIADVLAPGDVVYVAPPEDDGKDETKAAQADNAQNAANAGTTTENWRLMQIPKVEGAIVVMDPNTGRVLAVVGGFSYAGSQFDRATQALRQPGSSFKPIVYAAALDNGYTPSSIILDAPIAIDQGEGLGLWRPKNYGKKFYGPSTLRLGIEKSRNLMTVRLAQDIGMPIIAEYARRFGVYDNLRPVLSMALGAGETTLMRLVGGYSMFDNGGKQITPTLIDRIQDRYGHTIWRHDKRECPQCAATDWQDGSEPDLPDLRKQIISPLTAYQITSLLEGVVQRGTGYKVKAVGKPLAGKTGTTNEEKDAWFIGFAPDLAVGVFIGFDNPTPMGHGETGGGVASPVFRDFMKIALADKPAVPFRIPPGIKLIRINAKTGMRAQPEDKKVIMEAYKPNEEPPDPFSYVGYPGADSQGGSQAGTSSGYRYEPRPEAGGLY